MSTHADKAAELVLGPRNDDYGNPDDDFSATAMMISGLLRHKLREPITPVEYGLIMVCVKLRRHTHRAKPDNLVDSHGYLDCVEWIEKGERPVPAVEEANRTIESVCCGERVSCPRCGENLPCVCDCAPAVGIVKPADAQPNEGRKPGESLEDVED